MPKIHPVIDIDVDTPKTCNICKDNFCSYTCFKCKKDICFSCTESGNNSCKLCWIKNQNLFHLSFMTKRYCLENMMMKEKYQMLK